jgi:cyclase
MISPAAPRLFVRIFALCFPLAVLALAPALADTVTTSQRTVTKLSDGIYTIRHKDAPDTFPQGNTTVIIGEREVLVVDSCYLPSSAEEDIAQIRQWTTKPVRFLLNTHWHYDHTMGNAVYRDAFPGLVILAHTETRNQIAGYNPFWFEGFLGRAERIQKMINSGKDPDGKALTPNQIQELKTAVAGIEPVWNEFKLLPARLAELTPDATFERELTIDLGNREVQLKHLGRGNTRGDALVYLPKEKILITGDLLDHPVPYFFGGYPEEQLATLRRMSLLDAQAIVPGHGDVLHDKVYLQQEIDFIAAVAAEVKKAIYRLGSGFDKFDAVSEEVSKNLNSDALRKQFAGDDKNNRDFFNETLDGLIRAAYAESWGQ